tara:strand:- start:31956 stop:32942 length:987 start_codon:yes stop_codon:yes gene_type:complete
MNFKKSFASTISVIGALCIFTCLISITNTVKSSEEEQLEKITVFLDWFINPDHAPLFVALEKGYFTDAGLEVKLISPSDANDPPKLVAAGIGDIAISYQPQLHMQYGAGIPIKRIGTLVSTPLNTLLTLSDSSIKSIADLKGKKVGYSVGGFEEILLGAMLEKHGLKISDVTLINVNFSLSPALLSGQVDAVIGAYRNFELNQLSIEGHSGKAFYLEEEGIPAYDELIFIARTDDLHEGKYRRFIDSIERGVQFLINHPKDSWKLFIKGRPELNNELNIRAWADTLPRFALRPGALDLNRYKKFANFMASRGLIEKPGVVEEYAVELD